MLAANPKTLNHTHAASVPVVAVTAWQMIVDFARLSSGQAVLIHGGAGNVGGYAVQLAKRAGAVVIATASAEDASYVRRLGADGVIDYRARRFEERVKRSTRCSIRWAAKRWTALMEFLSAAASWYPWRHSRLKKKQITTEYEPSSSSFK